MNKRKSLLIAVLVVLGLLLALPVAFASETPPTAPTSPYLNYVTEELSNVGASMEYCLTAKGAEPATDQNWTGFESEKVTVTSLISVSNDQTMHIRLKKNGDTPESPATKYEFPKRYDEATVKAEFDPESGTKPKFNCSTHVLTVNAEGKWAVTDTTDIEKFSEISNTTKSLSTLVKGGTTEVWVKIFASNDKKRFASPAIKYNLYQYSGAAMETPDVTDILFTDDEKLKGVNDDKTIKNLQYAYDESTDWKTFTTAEFSLASKLGAKAFEMKLRTAPTADRPESAAITIKFEARDETPSVDAAGFDLDKATFKVSDKYMFRTKTGSTTTDWKKGASKETSIGSIATLYIRTSNVIKTTGLEDDDAKYAMVVKPQSAMRTITMPKAGAAPSVSYNKTTTNIKNVKVGMQFYVSEKDLSTFTGVYWNDVTSNHLFAGELSHGTPYYSATPSTEGVEVKMPGKYLYVRSGPVKTGTLKLASKPKKIYIPAEQKPIAEGKIALDIAAETLTGVDKTMEYRILKAKMTDGVDENNDPIRYGEITNPNQKYTGISKTSLPMTTHLDKMPDDEDWTIQIRYKASGSGTNAKMPSEPILYGIPHRPEAPKDISFDTASFGIKKGSTVHETDAMLTSFDFSTNNKTWKKFTMADLLKQVPKYSAKGTAKKLYIRDVGVKAANPKESKVASKSFQLMIPCRFETPKFKIAPVPSDSSGDLLKFYGDGYIKLPDDGKYAVSVDNGAKWTEITGKEITFGTGGIIQITDTTVNLQIKRTGEESNPESLPQKIKLSRAKAPKITVDFANEYFKSATVKHQFRMAANETALATATWTDITKDNLLSADGKKVLIDYDNTDSAKNLSGKFFQFRVKAATTKLASQESAIISVGKRAEVTSTAISTMIDYPNEILNVQSGVLPQYKVTLEEGMQAREKWVKVTKKGEISLTNMLDSTDTRFDATSKEAEILFRFPATKTEPASKTLPVKIPSRPGPSDMTGTIEYDFVNEATMTTIPATAQYSFNNKKWLAITPDQLVNGKLLLPATKKLQKVYFRAGAVAGQSFCSKTHSSVLFIPAQAKAPTYVNTMIDFSAENPSIILPEAMEFQVKDHGVYGAVWTKTETDGVPLKGQTPAQTIYDGTEDVTVYIRYTGSNENSTVPSLELTVKLAKQRNAPGLKYNPAINTITGAIKTNMQYGTVTKGGAESGITWTSFTASEQSAKKMAFAEFPAAGAELDIYVRYAATKTLYQSAALKIGTSVAKPAKPSGFAYDDESGQIKGAAATMEFSLDQSKWTAVKSPTMSFKTYATSAGTQIFFRYKATKDIPASQISDAVMVKSAEVKGMEPEPTPVEEAPMPEEEMIEETEEEAVIEDTVIVIEEEMEEEAA